MSIAPLFCQLALDAACNASPAERADLFDFAADILERSQCTAAATAAARAAAILREAEAAQLTFRQLLTTN